MVLRTIKNKLKAILWWVYCKVGFKLYVFKFYDENNNLIQECSQYFWSDDSALKHAMHHTMKDNRIASFEILEEDKCAK